MKPVTIAHLHRHGVRQLLVYCRGKREGGLRWVLRKAREGIVWVLDQQSSSLTLRPITVGRRPFAEEAARDDRPYSAWRLL